MSPADHPVVGILGGMGPEATVDLMRRVIAATPAADDADHVHMIIDNNPKVPSRIKALIERTGESPSPVLVQMAQRLEAAGATVLAMPCNTAHAYAEDIEAAVSIPFLDMIALTASRIVAVKPRPRRVGMLASTAVLRLGLYERALAATDIGLVHPQQQDDLMAIIRAVKSGKTGAATAAGFAAIATLFAAHCDMLLVACTELSILANRLDTMTLVVDSLDVLVAAILDAAGVSTEPAEGRVAPCR